MTEVRVVTTDAEYRDAVDVRYTVFVEGQDVPEELELDEYEDLATHFVAYDDDRAVGAARLRSAHADADAGSEAVEATEPTDAVGTTGKVERVAVVADRRGEGLGRAIMDCLEAHARDSGYERLKLHSQTHAAGFYDRLGYERVGEEFEEAGIPHVAMVKSL